MLLEVNIILFRLKQTFKLVTDIDLIFKKNFPINDCTEHQNNIWFIYKIHYGLFIKIILVYLYKSL